MFFIIIKGLSVAKNCLRPESAAVSLTTLLKKVLYLKVVACNYQVKIKATYLCKRHNDMNKIILVAQRKKSPNTELFLVRIFLYLDRIQENTDPKKLRIWTLLVD